MLVGDPPFVHEDPVGIYRKILTGKVRFPPTYDDYAKSLTKKLLNADLTKRYGCMKRGASDIKRCNWLADMKWDALIEKKLDAPIKPELSSVTDTSNFEEYPDEIDNAKPPIYDGPDLFENI